MYPLMRPSRAGRLPVALVLLVAGVVAAPLMLHSGAAGAEGRVTTLGRRGESGADPRSAYAQLIAAGQYLEAAAAADERMSRRARRRADQGEVDGRALQSYLMIGSALRWGGDIEGSLQALEQAEIAIKDHETRLMGSGAAESAGAAFLGSQVRRYRPRASDATLVNTYKALNHLALGQVDEARIEFHRSDERTRRAVELFARELEEHAEDEARRDNRIQSLISENYPDLSRWSVYDDFVNPYSVYVHALFFLGQAAAPSDIEAASTSIRRVAGMYPDSSQLLSDLELVEGIASGRLSRSELPDQVWVICEDGLSPSIAVKEIELEFTHRSGFFGASVKRNGAPERLPLPELKLDNHGLGGCSARGGEALVVADEIASMDRVAQSEFKKRLPFEVGQSISALLFGGHAISESLSLLRGNKGHGDDRRVDTRVWEGLPKTWYAMRLPRPDDGRIEILGTNGTPVTELVVPRSRMSLVHVRMPSGNSPPALGIAVLAP